MMCRFWKVISLLPLSILLTSCGSSSDSPDKIIPSIVRYGRLAELPKSATEIKAYAWSSMFSGEWFLRFKASTEDIQNFIASSQSIKGVQPDEFDEQRQHLPYPAPLPEDFYSQKGNHKYFSPDSSAPSWYDPTIKVKGRRYEVPAENNHNWGEVIVNDEKNIIYIKIVWS